MRTLKFGDRTISYDAGLNSLEDEKQKNNRRSLNLEHVEGHSNNNHNNGNAAETTTGKRSANRFFYKSCCSEVNEGFSRPIREFFKIYLPRSLYSIR